ncbi:MAG: right-handed parallel beta-helix repeat-containing protein, partial [Planctomycetota bacterium]
GAILCEGSSPTIINCIFYNNVANVGGIEAGGAIAILAGSSPVITNCVFEQNQGYTRGGAIACSNSEVLIEGCTFIENYQYAIVGFGGGIYLETAIATISSCLFVGNSADLGGGAIGAIDASQAEIVNCTFVGNKCRHGYGGAVYAGGRFSANGQVALTNCIFWSNMVEQPGRGDHIAGGGGIISYCDVEGGWDGPGVVDSSLVDGGGNIDVDPCFADLGYWSGPDYIWVAGDYHLQSGVGRWDPNSESWVLDDMTSPCIDKGDPNSPVGDEPDPNGGRVNMGVYGGTAEASKSATCWHPSACAGQPYGDANCDGNINLADLYALKTYFATCKGDSWYNCCADFDHTECVTLGDLYTLKAYFGTSGYSPSIGNQMCPP